MSILNKKRDLTDCDEFNELLPDPRYSVKPSSSIDQINKCVLPAVIVVAAVEQRGQHNSFKKEVQIVLSLTLKILLKELLNMV